MNFIFVALGGALGAVGRYTISLIPVKTQFPILTLITNLIGAFIIGLIVGITENYNCSKNTVLFWKVGICGGFTTFSTFSLEAYNLFENKAYGYCCLYVLLSVVGCVIGVWSGKKIATNRVLIEGVCL